MSFLLGALCACQIALAAPDTALTARELVARARTARYQQDARLSDYLAIARQRWSASIGLAAAGGFGPIGRMRLGARFETVARMGWHHKNGAWAELIASRAVAPIVGEVEPDVADDGIVLTLPYYPGRDRLWPMTEMLDALPGAEGGWIRHPLEAGSDSIYHFSLGGPLTITMPGNRQIRLRELLVRPVRPDQRLIVASLWLDISDGSLVRAAYRPSVAVDMWPYMEPNFDRDDRQTIQRFGPFRGNVEEIIVESGFYAEGFWLPRVRIAHAEGTAKGGRVTISIEQTFEYEHVGALAPGEVQAPAPDSLRADDGYGDYSRYQEWREGRGRGEDRPCRETGDTSSLAFSRDSLPHVRGLRTREVDGVRVRVFFPCERATLLNSKALPGTIYSPSDELFTQHDLTRLREETVQSLAISSQAAWEPQKPILHYGLENGLLRYNRIEALSAGLGVERLLGKGYTLDAVARIGVGDLEPNGELRIRRSSGHSELRAGAFRRLDVANDWGTPLGLSASLGALLLGRDDWMYHRALGVELGGTHHRISGGPVIAWRLFAERHDSAAVETGFSFAGRVAGTDFAPNVAARVGTYAGGAATIAVAGGVDPMGTQFSGVLKAEAAGGELNYVRASLEMRLAHGLGRGLLGSLSGGAGSSLGELPPQRGWYLGGAQTVHAHRVGAAAGDAFWMARAELTKGIPLIRPIIFADIGWAGDRRAWNSTDRLLAAGVGAAALDGLLRFDVSRALDASRRWSFDVFVELR